MKGGKILLGKEAGLGKVLINAEALQRRVSELGEKISVDYEGRPLTVVVVMQGALFFAADLMKSITLPLKVTSMQASSYHGGAVSGEVVSLAGFESEQISKLKGRHVLIVDEILDTGRTLHRLLEYISENSEAASVGVAVLLQKAVEREFFVETAYVGFDIGNEFVVGYGLDFKEEYRNLPFIGVLNEKRAAEL